LLTFSGHEPAPVAPGGRRPRSRFAVPARTSQPDGARAV